MSVMMYERKYRNNSAENHKITNMFKEVSENNNKILERVFRKIQSDTHENCESEIYEEKEEQVKLKQDG